MSLFLIAITTLGLQAFAQTPDVQAQLTELMKDEPAVLISASGNCQQYLGIASYYDCCTTTANGEAFNPNALTAAHRTLPFHTTVQVTNLANRGAVTVRINDRGPFIKGRIIDLTPAGRNAIGMDGLANVSLDVCL